MSESTSSGNARRPVDIYSIYYIFKEIDLRDLFIFAAFSIGNATATTLDEQPSFLERLSYERPSLFIEKFVFAPTIISFLAFTPLKK